MKKQDVIETASPSATKEVAVRICKHCQEVCEPVLIHHNGLDFCCEGCRMVYEILDENNLCDYYTIDQNAGTTRKNVPIQRYDFLDDENTRDDLLDFSDGRVARVHFTLPQMHCSACIWLLENLSKMDPGITSARVQYLRKEIHISFLEQQTTLRKIVELLASIGYAPILNLAKIDSSVDPSQDRSIYYKLGLAGFTFGNIMLLSFPEYLGLDPIAEADFFHFFGYLNLILIIPVVLYSGQDYLRSAWQGVKTGQLNIDVPVSIGILALFGRSAYEILTHSGAGYMDSLAGLLFFLLVGKWYQQKTYNRLSFDRDYRSYFPLAANVVSDLGEISMSIDKLKPGQTLRIRHSELIPTDAVIMRGKGFIDYSFVTGESTPQHKKTGDRVFAGGRQKGSTLEVQIIKKTSRSYLTQLWNEEIFRKNNHPSATLKLANYIAKYFTWVILVISMATLIYWLALDDQIAFQAFSAVLIVACPCAVALTIPFTLGNALRVLAERKIFLKNTEVVEKMQGITDIVFDKTGTLTIPQSDDLQFHGTALNVQDQKKLSALTNQSSHPVSKMIRQRYPLDVVAEVRNFREVLGQGIQGSVNGSLIKVGKTTFIFGDQTPPPSYPEDGILVQIDDQVRGYFKKQESTRRHLSRLITKLRDKYSLALLSGDHSLSRHYFGYLFGANAALLFDQTPKDKLDFIKRLQSQGKRVMMIGDGLNDAGALKQSDVGIVITENSNNFTPACDAILDASRFSQLWHFLEYTRRSIHLVYAGFGLGLIYNIVGLTFAVQGLLSPIIAAILMPLSSMTVVIFGITASRFLAKRVGL